MIKHILTQEDLYNNPDLVEAGLKVGDTIDIPEDYNEESFDLILDILEDTPYEEALDVLDAVAEYIIEQRAQQN